MKKVSFSLDTKEYDGCCTLNSIYHSLLKKALWGSKPKINSFDILKIVDNDIEMLNYFIYETNILIDKLEILEEEIFFSIFDDDEDPKEKIIEDPIWDNAYLDMKARKNNVNYVPIARFGSREINEKLSVEHKFFIFDFLNKLIESKKLLENKIESKKKNIKT